MMKREDYLNRQPRVIQSIITTLETDSYFDDDFVYKLFDLLCTLCLYFLTPKEFLNAVCFLMHCATFNMTTDNPINFIPDDDDESNYKTI